MSIRGRQSFDGYTIVEVLVFIALTSVLLVVAVANISGNQRTQQFSQSVRDFESQIGDAINDVPTGYFPSNDALTCDASLPGRPVLGDTGGDGLGEDEDCIYVGKALQFAPAGDDTLVNVYTLAGRRLSAAGTPAQSIDDSLPVAVARPTDASFPDTVDEIAVRFGVRVRKVFNADTPAAEYGSVGVLTGFEGSSPANEVSEAQVVQIGGIVGSSLGDSEDDAVSMYINRLTETLPATNQGYFERARDGIVICLIDSEDRKASLTIGATGSSGVRLDIDSYDTRCD